MARIRTIKPEAFTSESLAEVSVNAERTFFGLLTQADDHGRFRDNAAVINGLLWPLRPAHTSVHAEDDLQQLAAAGLICRYTGCDGRRYLHVVTWSTHQRIDKPSPSRVPACPLHHTTGWCGVCKGTCTGGAVGHREALAAQSQDAVAGASLSALGGFERPSAGLSPVAPAYAGQVGGPLESAGEMEAGPAPGICEGAGQEPFREDSPNLPRTLPEGSPPGSRILDPGSSYPSGRTAPAPAPAPSAATSPAPAPSARILIGAYVAGCAQRPPEDVLGHLGRKVRQLLDEGIAPDHIRTGLEHFRTRPMHPSVLPSLVNEAMNPGPAGEPGRLARPGFRPTVPGHTAWTNPVDAAAAYAEEL